MSTDLRMDPDADLGPVVAHVRSGGVLAYPTETVYGFGSLCTAAAVARIAELKAREEGKPLIVLAGSRAHLAELEWTPAAREFADVFWPGSVTLVLRDPRGMFPRGVRSKDGTVAVRVSPHPTVGRFLEALGEPITSTSVNLRGEAPARSGSEAAEVIRRLEASDVWLLNGGTLPDSAPSTIIDCTGEAPVVLREGTVPLGRLRCVISEVHGPHS